MLWGLREKLETNQLARALKVMLGPTWSFGPRLFDRNGKIYSCLKAQINTSMLLMFSEITMVISGFLQQAIASVFQQL